jgi:hypothetical protein
MTAIRITMVLMLMMVTFRLIAVKLGHGKQKRKITKNIKAMNTCQPTSKVRPFEDDSPNPPHTLASANAAVFPAAWGRCATLQNQ